MITPVGACMIATNQSMSELADMLSNNFDRPVTDMTGLKGKYDFHLRFDPSSMGGRMGSMMKMGPPPGGMAAGGGGAGGGMGTAGAAGTGGAGGGTRTADTPGGGGAGGGMRTADAPGTPAGAGPETSPIPEVQEMPPTIFTAIQEQLGLKLEAKKGPADLLVIDHVEKTPTEN